MYVFTIIIIARTAQHMALRYHTVTCQWCDFVLQVPFEVACETLSELKDKYTVYVIPLLGLTTEGIIEPMRLT